MSVNYSVKKQPKKHGGKKIRETLIYMIGGMNFL